MGKKDKNQGQGKNSSLGKALQNNMRKKAFKPVTVDTPLFVHQNLEDEQKKQILSVIDQDNLEEFLAMAKMADKSFQAMRGVTVNPKALEEEKEVISDKFEGKKFVIDSQKSYDVKNNQALNRLRIPRRPKWDKEDTADELHKAENLAFLEWRRGLAQIEEKFYEIHITPYEKNIDVWRQLWRTIERGDILVQIVDGRDPLFYRCEDLEHYVKDTDSKKVNFLLINKSDLLSEEIRKAWNKYFLDKGVIHMFFSAKKEQESINSAKEKLDHILYDQMEEIQVQELVNTHNIASRKELLYSLQKIVRVLRANKLKELEIQMKNKEKDQTVEVEKQYKSHLVTVGMVGYPNVGKSSVINTLCNKKIVGVASQPGKTKHLQTIFLDEDLLLCDCPGLVFPNAASTRGEMVCNGVLPIDKIRDYLSPIDVLVERIPQVVFEKLYGLKIEIIQDPRKTVGLTATQFLSAYAAKHNLYAPGSGVPEMAKVSKVILKDFVHGKLLYCKVPPTEQQQNQGNKIWQSNHEYENFQTEIVNTKQEEESKEQVPPKEDVRLAEQEFLDVVGDYNDEIPELSNEELMQLLEGKKVKDIKLTKEQRRDIKFRMQRGENLDYKEYLGALRAANKQSGYKNRNSKGLPSIIDSALN